MEHSYYDDEDPNDLCVCTPNTRGAEPEDTRPHRRLLHGVKQ